MIHDMIMRRKSSEDRWQNKNITAGLRGWNARADRPGGSAFGVPRAQGPGLSVGYTGTGSACTGIPVHRYPKLWKVRSRMYRNRILEVKTHFARFFKLYSIGTLGPPEA